MSEVRVLVIDDDADSREVTAAFLRSSGFDVEEFESAEEALPKARSAHAVVTDITLPGMSGYELASRIRSDAQTKGMVVFAVSGRSDASPEQARLFDRIVVKPFDPDALVSALEASTGGRTTTPAPAIHSFDAADRVESSTWVKASGPPTRLTDEHYRILVEHAPTMVWRAGLDAKCDYFNETWLAFTGRSFEEETEGWEKGVHPEDMDRCMRVYLTSFAQRVPFEMEYRLRRHDGVYRTLFDRGVPYFDDAGVFAGFIGSCVDVEERVEAERARTTFLAMMAHELRTPLTPLRAYQIQLERAHSRGETISDELLKKVARQIDKLAALVEHFGDAARLSARRELSIQPRPCDLAEIVRDVVERKRASLAGRRDPTRVPNLELDTNSSCPVRGDADRLAQLVEVVVDNAIKFSPEGGTVAVRVSTDGGEHRVSVRDTGIGIPPAELPMVGKAFYRATNASTENYPGIGLGLAVAKEIACAHGGTLELAGGDPAGIVATIRIPIGGQGDA